MIARGSLRKPRAILKRISTFSLFHDEGEGRFNIECAFTGGNGEVWLSPRLEANEVDSECVFVPPNMAEPQRVRKLANRIRSLLCEVKVRVDAMLEHQDNHEFRGLPLLDLAIPVGAGEAVAVGCQPLAEHGRLCHRHVADDGFTGVDLAFADSADNCQILVLSTERIPHSQLIIFRAVFFWDACGNMSRISEEELYQNGFLVESETVACCCLHLSIFLFC